MSKIFVTLGLICGLGMAAEPSGITRCATGAADILGSRKAFAVQVCNLFGAKCWMNHPSIKAGACSTDALEIDPLTCKLYPIFEFTDNGARVPGSVTEEMSTDDDLGCSVSSSNGVYKWSGACVSVQCDLGRGAYAGPATSGSSSSRAAGVADTSSATFQSHTLASISSSADQIKNVFLYRTGGHVATYSRATSGSSNSISYSVGNLPTSNGNNYGPVACPSRNNLLTSSTATGITAANLRMCGSTGKWQYYNAINLLKDTSLYAKYSGNTGSTSDLNIGSVPFLAGKSAYRSGTAMDDPRAVKLLSSSSSSSAISMMSETITPAADGAATGGTAGTWRNYGVVFYCDDYARTDLTACAATNQKMFYVGDPNPNVVFGTSARALGGSAAPTPTLPPTPTPLATPTPTPTPSPSMAPSPSKQTCLNIKRAYQEQKCCENPMGEFKVPAQRRLSGDESGIEVDVAYDTIIAQLEAGMKHLQRLGDPVKSKMVAKEVTVMLKKYISANDAGVVV